LIHFYKRENVASAWWVVCNAYNQKEQKKINRRDILSQNHNHESENKDKTSTEEEMNED